VKEGSGRSLAYKIAARGTPGQFSRGTEALEVAAGAAEKGAQATIRLMPKFGRAKTLGERAVKAEDPGGASMALLFRGLAEATGELPDGRGS
jgi:dihydroxyacetone kinase